MRIIVPVYVRLTLFLKYLTGIYVHDGPGMNSDQVNPNSSVIHLSSFQAFVVVFTDTWMTKYDMYLLEFGLTYKGRDIKVSKIHVYNAQILKLPPCTIIKHTNTELSKRSNIGVKHLNQRNLHCVYNITSSRDM